jgi:hypothetical protein
MNWSRFNGPLADLLHRLLQPAPDPWPADVAERVREKSAVPLCLNCLFPQGPHTWFCPSCAFPTGDYVVLMPYLQNYAVGEVLRRGVSGPPERRRSVQLFLVVYSICEYAIFAPLYWYWMLRRARGKPIATEHRPELILDETA